MGPPVPRVCAAGGHGQRQSDQEGRGRAAGEGEWRFTAARHPVTVFLSSAPRRNSHLCPQEYAVPFMETSAKTGVNVELAFTAVAKWDSRSLQGCCRFIHALCKWCFWIISTCWIISGTTLSYCPMAPSCFCTKDVSCSICLLQKVTRLALLRLKPFILHPGLFKNKQIHVSFLC